MCLWLLANYLRYWSNSTTNINVIYTSMRYLSESCPNLHSFHSLEVSHLWALMFWKLHFHAPIEAIALFCSPFNLEQCKQKMILYSCRLFFQEDASGQTLTTTSTINCNSGSNSTAKHLSMLLCCDQQWQIRHVSLLSLKLQTYMYCWLNQTNRFASFHIYVISLSFIYLHNCRSLSYPYHPPTFCISWGDCLLTPN